MKRPCVSLMVLALCVTSVLAMDQFEKKEKTESERPDKKKTGFIFHRSTAKDTPAEQLSFVEELLNTGRTNKAAREADMLVRRWHESPEAPKAQLLYAKLLDRRENYADAFDEYQYLMAWFAGSFKHEEVLDHQFRIANHLLNAKRMWMFDASEYALPLFEQIVRNAENWDKAPKVQFTIAQIQQKLGRETDAIRSYELIQNRYPDSEYATDAAFLRAQALYEIADRYPRDELACRDAISALAMCLRDHPRHELAENARRRLDELKDNLAQSYYDRAAYYDRVMHKSESALIAYTDLAKTFPVSDLAHRAQKRIDELNKIVEKEKK
jgi:outer membrane protein assembly factor BamD (BamD/ComL family)